jgi:large subunit ribosomal protein L9
MQVILKQNVQSLGKKGELKNVKDGYYLNYLLPRNLAEVASPAKIKQAEELRKREVVQHERIREQAAEIKEKMKGLKITIKAKAKGDKLYGSITEKEILDALQEKINVKLEKQHLLLSEHIKVAGTYEVPVRLSEGVEGKFTLEVKAEK